MPDSDFDTPRSIWFRKGWSAFWEDVPLDSPDAPKRGTFEHRMYSFGWQNAKFDVIYPQRVKGEKEDD